MIFNNGRRNYHVVLSGSSGKRTVRFVPLDGDAIGVGPPAIHARSSSRRASDVDRAKALQSRVAREGHAA